MPRYCYDSEINKHLPPELIQHRGMLIYCYIVTPPTIKGVLKKFHKQGNIFAGTPELLLNF